MARFEGFIGETYEARSSNVNRERCINLFPERNGANSKSPINYYNTPGMQAYITLPANPVRSLWAGDDRLFTVSGAKYGEILHSGGTPTFQDRGTVAGTTEPAYIFSNGTQTFIVAGGRSYCDNGGAATGANAVDVGAASSGTYLDGYFIRLKPTTNEVEISALLNGLTWNALDFQARISSSDRLIATVAHDEQLWLFGKRTISLWFNSGNADFPFEPAQGASIDRGAFNPHTIASLDGSLFFVSQDERGSQTVLRTRGYQLERVSTHAIEARISGIGPSDATAFPYQEGGHLFYVLTSYGGSVTFVYDVVSKLWHEWMHWDGAAFTSHLARCHAYTTPGYTGLGSDHYVGTKAISGAHAGKVYALSQNLHTDAGDAIRRYRQAPHLSNEENRVFHHALQVDAAINGVPNITLKWSDDDGATFTGDKVPTLTAGGDGTKRVIWRRLGASRDRIYGLTIHNYQAPLAIVDAFIEVTPGT